MRKRVVIADYGMGNLSSVRKALGRCGTEAIVTSDPNTIRDCDRLILPGVGHFGRAMSRLKEFGLIDALNEVGQVRKRPILGICLGMQLFADRSEEGDAEGLGWIRGDVKHLSIDDGLRYKVPQIGWNMVALAKESLLFKNVSAIDQFYFVHSYIFQPHYNVDILTETHYETGFVSAVEKDNIFGVQFHPEKSFDAGEQILTNFLDL